MTKPKQKSDPLIARTLKQLDDYKKRSSIVVEKKVDLSLTDILELCKEDIKKLTYKKYQTSIELNEIVSRLSIYYNDSIEFRKWCSTNNISSYLIKGSEDLGTMRKLSLIDRKVLGSIRLNF